MVFRPPFGLNNEYGGGILKGVSPVNCGSKGAKRVPVGELVEVVLHVGKGAKFGAEKVNGSQNICNRSASVGNGKNFEKQAQSSKG